MNSIHPFLLIVILSSLGFLLLYLLLLSLHWMLVFCPVQYSRLCFCSFLLHLICVEFYLFLSPSLPSIKTKTIRFLYKNSPLSISIWIFHKHFNFICANCPNQKIWNYGGVHSLLGWFISDLQVRIAPHQAQLPVFCLDKLSFPADF